MVVEEEAITQSSVGGTERHSTQLSDIPQSHRSGTVKYLKYLTLQGALITVSQHTHSTHVKGKTVLSCGIFGYVMMRAISNLGIDFLNQEQQLFTDIIF